MSNITVGGKPCMYASHYPTALVETLAKDTEAVRRAQMLIENQQTSLNNIPPASLGSIDATSCICPVYFWQNKHVIVHHHDDAHKLAGLGPLFREYRESTLDVMLIGGLITKNSLGEWNFNFLNLEKYTKDNFEQLETFWRTHGLKINLLGWAIGKDKDRSTLVSDFLAEPNGKVYIVKPEVMHTALKTQEAARRAITSLTTDQYSFVYDGVKGPNLLRLPDASAAKAPHVKNWASGIKEMIDDRQILKECSTTPDLEPSYFCQNIREKAAYILDDKAPTHPIALPLDSAQPVVILQGECGRRSYCLEAAGLWTKAPIL